MVVLKMAHKNRTQSGCKKCMELRLALSVAALLFLPLLVFVLHRMKSRRRPKTPEPVLRNLPFGSCLFGLLMVKYF